MTLLWVGVALAAGKGSHHAAAKRQRVAAADRAATRAYLQARLVYTRAQLANSQASLAAVRALESGLERECPGEMTGAPHESLEGLLEPGRTPRPSPRQEGEEKRRGHQWDALQSELLEALSATDLAYVHEAALAYVRAVRPLHWSEPSRTLLTRVAAETLELELGIAVPPVCADMKTWVSSGYLALASGTKSIERVQEELVGRVFAVLGRGATLHVPAPLSRFEGPSEKRLARTLAAAEASALKDALGSEGGLRQLEVALGLETQGEVEALENPHKGSVEIGHGGTLAGTSFKVYVEPPETEPGPLGETECEHPIGVAVQPRKRSAGGVTEGVISIGPIGGSGAGCVSSTRAAVRCEEGRLTIELRTMAAARRVRLTLSDGRQVSSRVYAISRRLGGPAGIYYQAVRGPSPTPVRLEELGARGKVLRTIEVAHTSRCPPLHTPEPRRRTRTVATGGLPGAGTFAIEGTSTTFRKQTSFSLRAEAGPLGSEGSTQVQEGFASSPRLRRTFAAQLESGCRPAEFALVYGLLKRPKDVVLARTASGLVTLRRARIPKGLHAHGVLAYLALPSVPEELLVRAPDGRTLSTERFASAARDAHEFCEGEAEG